MRKPALLTRAKRREGDEQAGYRRPHGGPFYPNPPLKFPGNPADGVVVSYVDLLQAAILIVSGAAAVAALLFGKDEMPADQLPFRS